MKASETDRRGRPDGVKVIQVVEVVYIRGKGIDDDPVRQMKQYWSLDGELLATSHDYHSIDEDDDHGGHA